MSSNINILWVDDEIELLRPHIIFLEKRGYTLSTATNADDALDMLERTSFDFIFLDENMPGLRGLEALGHIKKIAPTVPVVMVTKSEEEDIMDRAVGAKIADYLIKPVKPSQMLIAIKKNLHGRELESAGTTSAYQSDYRNLADLANTANTYKKWIDVHRQLCEWRLSLLDLNAPDMLAMNVQQQHAANAAFTKFIRRNYLKWFKDTEDKPLISPQVLREKVFPVVDRGEKVLLLMIDNLRYDQWRMLRAMMASHWRVASEDLYYSILPTVTHYARNAFFAGLMPLEIESMLPELWVGENDPEGKNVHEEELLRRNAQRLGKEYQIGFYKGASLDGMPFKNGDYSPLQKNDLTVIVYNFVDMLSHSRHDMDIVKKLANDEHGYLSLTQSWFKHSDLLAFLEKITSLNIRLMVTTDHGSIQVKKPVRVLGNRDTSTNLRYKMGKNLAYNDREVVEFIRPADAHLPQANVSSRFIFAPENGYFVYPNNYNQYVNIYRDSFQHGGVSLEEMIVPIVSLYPVK